jgi:hypothetical protein
MLARRSRSSEAALRLLKTTMGLPKAFRYMIFSMISLVNLKCRVRKNGIVHTKLSFAILLEHPALIPELKGVSENRKTPWTGWNFAPWAVRILCCQNDDETQNESNTGSQKLGEYRE